MADYRVEVFDLITGKVAAGLPVISASWSHVRNAPGTISAAVAISQPDSVITALGSLIPDNAAKAGLLLTRDGTIVAGGPWWTWQADLTANTLKLNGNGWHSYVRRRVLREDKNFSGQDQTSVIAASLVNATQSTGRAPTISTDDVVASGVTRDRHYKAAERNTIGKLIEDLASVRNGFTFRYDTVRSAGVVSARFLTGPETGRKTKLVFEQGKAITKLRVTGDGTAVVTHVDGVGAGTGAKSVRTTVANASLIGSYPLLDDVVSHSDVSVRATLDEYARHRLTRGKTPVVLPTFDVNPDVEPVLGSYVVGDVVRVSAGYGLVDVDGLYQIVQISGRVDQDTETVSITPAPLTSFIPI